MSRQDISENIEHIEHPETPQMILQVTVAIQMLSLKTVLLLFHIMMNQFVL